MSEFSMINKSSDLLDIDNLEIANFIFTQLNGFIFHKNLIYNKFEYKLFCLIPEIEAMGNTEYIEIDNGYFNVDMDCIINWETYEICDYLDDDNDIFELQSLRICNGGKLTVLSFGNLSTNNYLMGYIRIHCYRDMIIDENCCIDVNGKGYYGINTFDINNNNYSSINYSSNFGRGQSAEIKLKKKKKKELSFGQKDMEQYYGGGGYGSNGGDCYILNDNKKKGKNKNNKKKLLCSGGKIYGDEKLEILYFGSSGGKGGKLNDDKTDRGGGIIELIIDNKLINNGLITSNGVRGQSAGGKYSGGSGGSIKIICNKLINSNGIIQVNGGKGYQQHGNGGNGRIAIYHYMNINQNDKINIIPKQNVYYKKIEKKKIINIKSIIIDKKTNQKQQQQQQQFQPIHNQQQQQQENKKNKNKKKGWNPFKRK